MQLFSSTPTQFSHLHTPIFDKLYKWWYCWIEDCSSFNMIPYMIYSILTLLKYNRSESSFLTFCAGYKWHYVCNDVIIWFAYKWSKTLTKKLARGLKRFSIFQLTKFHQKTSVFTKCPRDPQKWTIAPALYCAIAADPKEALGAILIDHVFYSPIVYQNA